MTAADMNGMLPLAVIVAGGSAAATLGAYVVLNTVCKLMVLGGNKRARR